MDNIVSFKKLFKIHYNNKVFQLFCDLYGRVVFLEIIDNKFCYPFIDDFIYLNRIYNNKVPFVSYDGKRLNDKKYSFKEFVRFVVGNTSFLMAVICSANMITTSTMGNRINVKVEDNQVKIEIVNVDKFLIKNTSELDSL